MANEANAQDPDTAATEEVVEQTSDVIDSGHDFDLADYESLREDSTALDELPDGDIREVNLEKPGSDPDDPEDVPEVEEAGEQPSQEAAEPVEEQQPTTQEDDPNDDPSEKLGRYRFRANSQLEDDAFKIRKENPLVSLEDALAQAREAAGLPPLAPVESIEKPEDDLTEDEEAATTEPMPQGVAAIKAAMEEADKAEIAALADFDSDAAQEQRKRRRELEAELQTAQASEVDASQQWEESLSYVETNYPASSEADSAFTRRMREVDEAWRDMGDQRYQSADKPKVIADLVAKEMGIKPGETTLSQPVQQSAVKPSQAQPLIPPASGSARSGGAPIAPIEINSTEDWETQKERLLAAS